MLLCLRTDIVGGCDFCFCPVHSLNFYRDIVHQGRVPAHDILLTNPPFEGEHIQATLRYCLESNGGRPCCILLPCFVAKKPYFKRLCQANGTSVLYLKPKTAYSFWSPGRPLRDMHIDPSRGNEADLRSGRPTSPMETMWFCFTGAFDTMLLERWREHRNQTKQHCTLTRSLDELDLGSVNVLPTKKPNPKRRRKLKQKQKRDSSS